VNSTEPATVVALDVGGTTIKGGLFGAATSVPVERLDRPTGAALGPAHVVQEIIDLAARLGVPVALEHDARAATLAELESGLGREVPDLMTVVMGTGIAAGLVIGGRLVVGASASAGEFGHLPVYPQGEPCGCGQRGCVEVYASAGGIARRYRAGGGTPGHTAADIVARLDTDALGRRIWTEAVDTLALGLASATLLIDPALIVLAGGLSNAGDRLLDPLRPALQNALAWRPAPPLTVSPLGDGAGLAGAAILALRAAGLPAPGLSGAGLSGAELPGPELPGPGLPVTGLRRDGQPSDAVGGR
jgi:glucokinase